MEAERNMTDFQEDNDRQRTWLFYLNKTALPVDKSIQVCERVDWKRMSLNEAGNRPMNHRVILPNEIVIETDRPNYGENLRFARIIASALLELGIPYTMSFSGNKSFHFHVFLDWNVEIKPKRFEVLKKNDFCFHDLKQKVAEQLFGFLQKLERICFGDSYLDYANLYKNKLIREFGGLHEKSGCYKTYLAELPEDKPEIRDSTLVQYPTTIGLWKCDETLEKAIRYWKPHKKKSYKQVFSP